MSRIWAVLPLLAVVVGCEPRLSPPPGAQLQCTASDQCPDGFVCREAIGRCVPADSLGNTTPPALVGTPAVAPALGKSGTRFSVSFEVTEALAETPIVTAEMKTETAAWTLDAAESSGNRYTFSYTATGSEPEGVVRLFVDLIDTDGNPAKGVSLPSVLLDFKAPELVSNTSSPSSAKAGDVLAYSVSASEKLLSAPTLVVKQNGTVVTDFFGAPTTATDSYFVWTKNIAGALDGDFTVEVSLVDEAGNAAGPLTGSAFSIDSTVPQLSGLTVTPRAKANDTVTVSFDVSEQLPSTGGVNVTVGSQPMSCGAYSSTAPNYTCTYAVTGNELGGANEAAQTVLVKVTDAAGNRAESAGSVTFDFKPPSIVSSTANPASAKAGDVVVYTVNVSEKLQSTPVLLVKKGGVTQANFFGTTTTASDTSFTWAKTLSGSGLDGTYTVEVSLTDEAGNAVATLPATGFFIDSTPPQLSALTVVTSRVKSGGTVTVTFDSSEALGASSVVATVGSSAMTCSAYQASSPNYSCTYAVTGSEIAANTEAPQTVLVKLIDAAGNRAEAAGSVTFDFQAPSLITGTPSPATSKVNDTLRYTVNVSETLTGTPTVVVKKGGVTQANFFGAAQTLTPTNFVYSAAITNQADGLYAVEITLVDSAGNTSQTLNGTDFTIDTSVPTVSALTVAPARVKAGQVVTATFDSAESVPSSGVSVALGASAMSCDPYQAASPNYTCRYTISATEIPANSEVTRSVVVKLTDSAGNRGEDVGGVAIDFKAPALVSTAVSPPIAKENDVLAYSANVSEMLSGAPVLVVKKGGAEQVGFFGAPASSGTNYTWSRTISGSLDGTYTVEVSLTDEAGNAVAALPATGFSIDSTPPQLSALTVVTPRVKSGGTVTVTFDSSEALGATGVVATVGSSAMTCSAYQASAPNYSCTYAVTGSEIAANTEAPQTVLVKLIDAAGNRAEAAGSVTFDFQAPSLITATPSPTTAKANDTLRYSVNVSETLTGTPTVVVKKGGVTQANFFGAAQTLTPTNFVYSAAITNQADGLYAVEITLVDSAGNTSQTLNGTDFTIDTSVPTVSALTVAPARVKAGQVVTATFDSAESVPSSGVSVTLGASAMSCDPYQAASPNYTCRYTISATEIPANSEVTRSVVVKLNDSAGNRGEDVAGIAIDFKAPSLVTSAVSPQIAKQNDVLAYSVNVSEPLLSAPALVVKKAGVTQTGFFGAPTQSGTNYSWSRTIDSSLDGDYTVELTLTDEAGNSSAVLSGVAFSVDTTVPVISGVLVTPERVKVGGVVTVRFNSTEAVGSSGVSANIGAFAMSCGAHQATQPNYTCTYTATGSETAVNSTSLESVLLKLVDPAGNRSEGTGSVTFDFQAPSDVSSSSNPPTAKDGDYFIYTLNVSEKLQGDPVLVVKKGGVTQPGFFGTPEPLSDTSFIWNKVISGPLDGTYTVETVLTDEAGNTSATLPLSIFTIDASVPAVSAVVVSPERAKAGSTITVRFDASEQVDAAGVSASIGAATMSCGAYQATSPNYTCTYAVTGTEITANTEASRSLLVKLVDAAGNRGEGVSSVVFDFKAPGIVSTSASPSAAKDGDTLAYTVNVNESLTAAPTLVVKKSGVTQAGFFGAPSASSGTNFVWTKSISGALDGTYTVEISFNDEAGNPSGALNGAGFSIDTTVPVASLLTVSPPRVNVGSAVTLTFNTSEQLPGLGVVATAGDRTMGCDPYSATPPNYTCRYTLLGDEIAVDTEEPQTVLLRLVDAAGNRSESAGTVLYDFKKPAVVNAIPTPLVAKSADTLRYTVNVSEALSSAPTVVVKKGGVQQTGFFGAPTMTTATSYVFETPISTQADGEYTVEIDLTDLAGNSLFAFVATSFNIDASIPTISALTVSPSKVKAGDTVTATFSSTENVGSANVEVKLGANPMSCNPYQAAAPNYTCTRVIAANEIGANTEQPRTVLVRLVDAAGNRDEEAANVIVDFKAPGIVTSGATPSLAKNGDKLTFTVSFNEALLSTPSIVVKKSGVEQLGFFSDPVSQNGNNYTWTKSIPSGVTGDYTIDLSFTDEVGNSAALVGAGSFSIDSIVPVISALNVSPLRVKSGDSLTVFFNVSEPLPASGVTATVGPATMSCGAYSATAPNYECTYTVTGTEITANTESFQSVLISVEDAAGNGADMAGGVTLDFKPPTLVSGKPSPSFAKKGDTLVYSVNVSEPITGAPMLVVKKMGTEIPNFFGSPSSASGTNYLWTRAVSSTDDGTYTVTMTFTDTVGNPSGTQTGDGFSVDATEPVISNLINTARVKASSTINISFNVAEPVSAVVTVGARPASCGAYQATSPSFTCSYVVVGDEIPSDSEATQPIKVAVSDVAGNQKEAFSGVAFDFLAPTLRLTLIDPALAKDGDKVVLRLSASEGLVGAPALITRVGGSPVSFFTDTNGAEDLWLFSGSVDSSWFDGSYTTDVQLTDLAGNVSPSLAAPSFTVDRTAPVVMNLALSKSRVKSGDDVTVTFDSTESIADAKRVVQIGSVTPTCGSYQPSPPNFTCTYKVTGFELPPPTTEGAQTVSVALEDTAGNRGYAFSSLFFDFRPPGVSQATVEYTPHSSNPLTSVTAATEGTVLTVRVAPDEDLSSSTPVLTAKLGAYSLPAFGASLRADKSIWFTTTVPSGAPDGTYDPRITWSDLAGNVTTTATFAFPQINVKTSKPTLTVDQDNVTFVRSPIGNGVTEPLSPGPYGIPGGPYFSLTPKDPLSSVDKLPATTFVMGNGQVSRLEVWAESSMVSLLGILPPNGDGTWPRTKLTNADTPVAWVTALDQAGNRTAAAVKIVNTEWVATTNAPLFGTSPHELLSQRVAERVLPYASGAAETFSGSEARSSDGQSLLASTSLQWEERPSVYPNQRENPAAAYDAARGRLIIFGGQDGVTTQDLWEWDGSRWFDRTPNPLPPEWPSARNSALMVHDAKRNRVVLFGGNRADSLRLNDLWEWDGEDWRQHVAQGSDPWPQARWGGALVYDHSNHATYLFGGQSSLGDSLNDLWRWDGTSWTNLTPATLPAAWPSVRYRHGLAWSVSAQRLVLFGGTAAVFGPVLRDMWQFDPVTGTWQDLTPATFPANWPSARSAFSFAFDAARSKVVLFGGTDGSFRQDLWEWDGASWTDRTPGVIPSSWPNARINAPGFYDHHRGYFGFFGGRRSDSSRDATFWEWNGTSFVDRTHNTAPDARTNQGAAWDTARQRLVIFGGVNGSSVYLNDTWTFDGSRWRNVSPATSPSARIDPRMTYDSVRGRVVMFGGKTGIFGPYLNDVWEWDGTNWINRTPGTLPPSWPIGRDGTAISYDPVQQRTLLFGGANSGYPTELWEWNGAFGSWISRSASGSWPVGRRFHQFVYDAARARTVLYGGDTGLSTLGDTWTWNSATLTWTQMSPATSPGPRLSSAMAYDPSRQRVVLFGGAATGTTFGDVWEWDGSAWVNKTPAALPRSWPAGRSAHTLSYDTVRSRLMTFGGGRDGLGTVAELWELNPAATRTPAITFTGSALTAALPWSNIYDVKVRAFCGGTGTPYTAAGNGSELEGWSAAPGQWISLASNSSGVNATQPYLTYPANTFIYDALTAAEARRFFMERDGHFVFRCRSTAGAGVGANDAKVALDYIEVRVRYTAP